ncbi:hypothetical protein [Bythopirellula polymerisocia]|uniref:Uncharacterized protein n=1 Tax=Bythopirellula polymerisocia TaxID=2528003 RepID=A0A5C6CL31_9BACT|nr:hypothetical protein [Bythopirellula polymerisocia]TWU24775.1 hypothetical protein Pla144_36610 [Bythopirellula polymerisocia]
MHNTLTNSMQPRAAVLVVSHPNGHLEVFGDRHIVVHIARLPVANNIEAERIAQNVVEMLLDRPFLAVYRADKLRAVGTTRPLLPTVLARELATNELIRILNEGALSDTPATAPVGGSEVAGTWI